MFKISDESYERVTVILEDIGYACDVRDYYEEWEDVARSSFSTVLDDLDTNQFNMTCAAIRERIIDEFADGNENYAKGIKAAFYGYLKERRDYLEFNGYYDKPELPDDDEDEYEMQKYEDAKAKYDAYEEYTKVVDEWIDTIGKTELE